MGTMFQKFSNTAESPATVMVTLKHGCDTCDDACTSPDLLSNEVIADGSCFTLSGDTMFYRRVSRFLVNPSKISSAFPRLLDSRIGRPTSITDDRKGQFCCWRPVAKVAQLSHSRQQKKWTLAKILPSISMLSLSFQLRIICSRSRGTIAKYGSEASFCFHVGYSVNLSNEGVARVCWLMDIRLLDILSTTVYTGSGGTRLRYKCSFVFGTCVR
jgi:hypothetical protein